jgi:hypothetical protein
MKTYLFCALLLFCGAGLHAQQAPAPAPKLIFEKVFIHTDKDYYAAGDNIWFKAYIVNGKTNGLINSSSNLHVELIAPDAQIVNSEVVELNGGAGTGDFKLTDSIPAGNYHLRAYTSWMRNFGDNFIFEKNIIISAGPTDTKVVPTTSAKAKKPTKLMPVKTGGPVLRFFPEGGSMIEDVPGIVAFKAEGPSGNNIAVKGSVISSTGDTVARFESTKLGVGSMGFVPAAKTSYTVKGVFNGNSPFTMPMPAALPKGVAIRISGDTARFRISLSTNQASLADYTGKQLTLTVRHTGARILTTPITFTDLQTGAVIAKNQFSAGVSSVTITDDQQHVLCERLVYVEEPRSVKGLSVKTDQKQYASKSKVTVKINATDVNHQPVVANLSLAAVDADLTPVSDGNIVSYLMLQSEVRGKIEHAETFFDTTNVNRFKQIDLLLLTQGWRDYVWRRMIDTSIRISYPLETGFSFTGRLREKFADKPLPGMNITLNVKSGKMGRAYLTKTDADGRYLFKDIIITGTPTIVLTAFDDKQKKAGLISLDSIDKSPVFVNQQMETGVDTVQLAEFFKTAAIHEALKAKLQPNINLKEVKVTADKFVTLQDQTTTKFGYKDFSQDILPKDLTYNNLNDYLIHEVPGAQSNANDSVTFLGHKFDADKNHFSQVQITPRFVVNGMEDADDLAQGSFLTLSMNMVNHVVVRHVLGQSGLATNSDGNGRTQMGGADVYIIYLDVKPNAFDKVDFNTMRTEREGYYQARVFYKPLYDSGPDNKPDLRSTITWEPSIFTDASGQATVSFYNADPKSKIRIVVQGITEKGIPVSATAEYVVK